MALKRADGIYDRVSGMPRAEYASLARASEFQVVDAGGGPAVIQEELRRNIEFDGGPPAGSAAGGCEFPDLLYKAHQSQLTSFAIDSAVEARHLLG